MLGICVVGSPYNKIYNNIIFLQYFLCKKLILFKYTMNYVRPTHLPKLCNNKYSN